MAVRKNAYELKTDLLAFSKIIEKNIQDVVTAVAFNLFEKIVDRTPVATGRAVSGWAISQGVVGEYVPPKPTKAAKPQSAPAGAMGVIDTTKSRAKQVLAPGGVTVEYFSDFFIYNNVEYIQALEYGHSRQAPSGMVRVSLAELETEIEMIKQRALK